MFHTLGCRLNQSESDTLAAAFSKEGYQVVNHPTADICVINTCSVTESAEAKCRNIVRKTLRQSPNTFIAVTGCYAQVGVPALKKIPGIDLIAGTEYKMMLPSLVEKVREERLSKLSQPLVFHTTKIGTDDFSLPLPTHAVFNHPTRPNIKIQDGCNFFCTFCIIPFTRGRERSRKWEDVLLEASLWAAQGHHEIVLTGVNMGEYSSEGRGVADLVEALEAIEGLARIRISSIEPTTVPSRLYDRMREGKVCPYLHLPLQSGSNTILSNMGRRYTREDYIRFVEEACRVPDLCLGADVMVGFPGEGSVEFDETVALIESLPFAYLHVFPFSERKGTRVTRMGLAKVPSSTIKKRVHYLLDLSKKKKGLFYQNAVGRSFDVLFEHRNEAGLFEGLTGNYIRVGVATNENLSGQIRPIRIEKVTEGLAYGVLG
jgi:threonylcarbamoyladenosine tRNA methylthiotransferase MtaB